jgi:peroxiredoxin
MTPTLDVTSKSRQLEPGDALPTLALQHRGLPFKPPTAPKGTLYYFMRTADCPVCRAHVRRLTQLSSTFERAGFSVVVVVNDVAGANSVATSLKPPFPVVSGAEAHRGLGFERVLFGLVQQSGTVVVDARNVIVKLVRATLPTSAFPEDDLLTLAGS